MIQTVEQLIEAHRTSSISERNQICEKWIDEHFNHFGYLPNSYSLQKLADWLLEKELKDTSRSKVQNNEYPILSKPQLERRGREISFAEDIVDILHLKKVTNQPLRKNNERKGE